MNKKRQYAREYKTKQLALKALDVICKTNPNLKKICRPMELQSDRWVILYASHFHTFLMQGYKNGGYWWSSKASNVR